MDRTEEIKELMVRLVTILSEEQSQMRREITELRKAVERMTAGAPELVPAGSIPAEEDSSRQPSDMKPISPEGPADSAGPESERGTESGSDLDPDPDPELLAFTAPVPFRFKDLPEDEGGFPASDMTETEARPQDEPSLSGPQSDEESVGDTRPVPVPDTEDVPVGDGDDDPEINPGAVFDPDKEPEFVVEPIRKADSPRDGVLRPRSREEQINDTSEWGMFSNSGYASGSSPEEVSAAPLLGELFSVSEPVSPKEPSWMTDIPGPRVNSVYEALTNNDRFQFIRELFDDDDEQFTLSMERIDQCNTFGQAVKEMRVAFPEWDESSPLVYQFYMMIRRRFR